MADIPHGGLLVVGVASLLACVLMARRTRSAMRAAAGSDLVIVDLELAWDAAGFREAVKLLSPAQCHALAKAHDWDSGFALTYSIALCALLEWHATLLQPPPQFVVAVLGLCGLAAGVFDLVENLFLQRCLRDTRYTAASQPLPADGPVRLAACAAVIKFLLAGISLVAIALLGPAAFVDSLMK